MNGFHANSNEDVMNSDSNSRFSTSHYASNASHYDPTSQVPYRHASEIPPKQQVAPQASKSVASADSSVATAFSQQPPVAESKPPEKPSPESNTKLAAELSSFKQVAERVRLGLQPAVDFKERCQQAFDVANDLFGHAPTWVCFYRELMASSGVIQFLFPEAAEFGAFLRSDQYHQIQLMLTALRGRDLPENDPNDPQRMITVRLPKSLHEAMCEEAGKLNISVNRLCISRMLQLLDPKMIPETNSKPRGRKPRSRQQPVAEQAEQG